MLQQTSKGSAAPKGVGGAPEPPPAPPGASIKAPKLSFLEGSRVAVNKSLQTIHAVATHTLSDGVGMGKGRTTPADHTAHRCTHPASSHREEKGMGGDDSRFDLGVAFCSTLLVYPNKP